MRTLPDGRHIYEIYAPLTARQVQDALDAAVWFNQLDNPPT